MKNPTNPLAQTQQNMKRHRPALIAGIAGLALCLGLGAVGASAAELSSGGFMVRSVSGNIVGYAGQRPEAAVVVPEQPAQPTWGDIRFNDCQITAALVSLSWSHPVMLKPGESMMMTTEVEYLRNGEVVKRSSKTWPLSYNGQFSSNIIMVPRSDASVVGARVRVVVADNPSKASRWLEFEAGADATQCTIR